MPAPQSIVELVERFGRNERAYRSAAYNERDVRTEFIDPLFQALGWDVHNVSGWAEPYKDVVREHSLRIEGRLSAPDYSFRIGGTRKFFVEAKKPAVNIKTEREPAFQLRRYAWSAKLPLSILTDFEELAVYDCRVKPERNARASTARVMYMTYREYLHRWDEIEAVFSRDAVLRGSFDSYAQDTRGKRGTAEVDAAFLGDMQTWRRSLAVAFAAKNRTLTETELNYAVQQTIDRIVFLRISEDRGIEPYGRLGELTSGSDVYRRLQVFFNRADKRYNSGLFHFRQERGRSEEPDVLTPSLQLPDKPLKDIIRGLYYPESPYEFSVVPPDILGQVYEQFLGQVIRLTARHQARVEDKPEVRRAGGVYYTPTHVVNYIVQHTLGKLLEAKTVRQAANIRIVDPACGSGSFLLGAYEFLLDWHLRAYIASDSPTYKDRVHETPTGELRLTTHERRRILLNSVYGVDIDSQAVEVTKLSLMLKVLEGESEEALLAQLALFHERALPDLGDNIKWGNSLISSDLDQLKLPAEDEALANPFDWSEEFPQIMRAGGFDAVIGNPPYDVIEKDRGKTSWPHAALAEYIEIAPGYEAALGGKLNLYRFFIVRSLELTRSGGRFGMIVPLSLLGDISVGRCRRHLFTVARNLQADCFPQKDDARRRVFRKAKLSTAVVTCERTKRVPRAQAAMTVRVYPWNSFDDPHSEATIKLSEVALVDRENLPIPLTDQESWSVCVKLYAGTKVVPLKAIDDCVISRGEINQTIYRRFITSDPGQARLVKGVEVGRFHMNPSLSQGEREWLDEARFLREHKARPIVDEQRIATQRITGMDERLRIVAAIVPDQHAYFADSTNAIHLRNGSPYALEYVLGLLNSTLFQWRFKLTSTNNNVGTNELEAMPFRVIDFSDPGDRAFHERVVGVVRRMMELEKKLQAARIGGERQGLLRRIRNAERRLDTLAYEMFGLADEDVAVIEHKADGV